MKNSVIFALVVVTTILAGCNKGGSSDSRVKKITSNRGFTTEYTYSAENKISSTRNSDGSKTTYTFNGNTVAQQMSDSARGLFITSTMFLNAKGWTDSTRASDQSGTYVKAYTHDADGYITQSRDIVSGRMTDASSSVFKDGNEISATVSDSTSKPLFTVYFDYYTDKPNSLSYANFGMKFLGNDSKNLMKRFVQVLPSGDTFRVNSFVYHFDDKGRVSQKAMYDRRGALADSTTITYY